MEKIKREEILTSLVGEIEEEDMKYVDAYIAEKLGVFIPSVGFCQYAIRPNHTHPTYSFVIFPSLEQSLVEAKIEVKEGHYLMVAMSPNIPHEEDVGDSFRRYIAIMINSELFEKKYFELSSRKPNRYFWDQFVVGQEVMLYIRRFMEEAENPFPDSQENLNALTNLITSQITRDVLELKAMGTQSCEKFGIEDVLEYMNQSFGLKLTNSVLAKRAKMSESHFIRVFKREMGQAPMEYLIKLRIEKSKKLLKIKVMSITEVSNQCGFNSTSHFSSCFQKHMGISPSKYRENTV